jgi:hypothetical protein
METLRRLVNKSKLLTSNSNFTLQVSSIDGIPLIPEAFESNLLVNGLFSPDGYYADRNLEIKKILDKLVFTSNGFANTFFQFNLGLGLPKNYLPHGIRVESVEIYLDHNLSFAGPRTDIWKSVLPEIKQDSNGRLYQYIPTEMFRLLSELLERKIYLEFPAIVNRDTAEIYGAIPTVGNLKGYLREKRII